MVTWNNLDTLASFKELSEVERVNLVEAMSGENGEIGRASCRERV